jgi:Ca-activated chloride channel family protein
MSFIWPAMLITLALVPICVVLYARMRRRRQARAAQYGSMGMLRAAAGQQLGVRRHIPPALFLAGLTALLVALARPETTVSLPRREGTIVLVFDVSGSMAAEDIQPTRMEAAKAAAREFVERQPRSVDIGIVAFSDSGLAVQVPTNERDIILETIDRLKPERGTSLGQGILASLDVIMKRGQPEPRLYSSLAPTPEPTPEPDPDTIGQSAAIVLLTDGENNENPDPLAAAQAAAQLGIRIYAVGIGSASGTTLHVNGFNVFTQLNEPMLQGIAQLTQGAYFHAQNQEELRGVYESINLRLVMRPEKTEITALLAGAGLLILMLGAACSMAWFGRVP